MSSMLKIDNSQGGKTFITAFSGSQRDVYMQAIINSKNKYLFIVPYEEHIKGDCALHNVNPDGGEMSEYWYEFEELRKIPSIRKLFPFLSPL